MNFKQTRCDKKTKTKEIIGLPLHVAQMLSYFYIYLHVSIIQRELRCSNTLEWGQDDCLRPIQVVRFRSKRVYSSVNLFLCLQITNGNQDFCRHNDWLQRHQPENCYSQTTKELPVYNCQTFQPSTSMVTENNF